MKCVKCSGELASRVIGKVVVDSCGDCNGVWFDKDELHGLLSSAVSHADELFTEGTPESAKLDQQSGDCPRCHQRLSSHESMAVDGLTYDQCEGCGGAWLDGGELIRLARDPATADMLKFFNELS